AVYRIGVFKERYPVINQVKFGPAPKSGQNGCGNTRPANKMGIRDYSGFVPITFVNKRLQQKSSTFNHYTDNAQMIQAIHYLVCQTDVIRHLVINYITGFIMFQGVEN